jgi:hypothetical protein
MLPKVPSFVFSLLHPSNPTPLEVRLGVLAMISAADGVLSNEEEQAVLSYIQTTIGADAKASESAFKQFRNMHILLIAKRNSPALLKEAVKDILNAIEKIPKNEKSVLLDMVSTVAACDGIDPQEPPVIILLRRALES